MGFTFDDTDRKGVATSLPEMERLIGENPRNREVIFLYIGGQAPVEGNGRQQRQKGIIPLPRRHGPGGDMDHNYFAKISRDEEAGVWYVSDTNFPGLVAEAASERELQDKIRALVPELYELNRNLFDEPAVETIPLRMLSSRLETIPLAG